MSHTFLKLLHAEHQARQIKFFPKVYIDQELEDLKIIIREIIKYYGYSHKSILCKSNHPALVEVRHMIAFVANSLYGISTLKIGQRLGHRHHTVIIKGRDKIVKAIENGNRDILFHLERIKNRLGLV